MPRKPTPPEDKRRHAVEALVQRLLNVLVDGKETAASRKYLNLEDTARRVARMWVDETLAYPAPPDLHITDVAEGYVGDILAVGPMSVSSTCAHHLMPFVGEAYVAYLADKRLLGLSKIPRLVRYWASRLQLQERLTQQIADDLVRVLKPRAVLVVLTCTHGCVSCRGVREANMLTTSSALRYTDKVRPEGVISELYAAVSRAR